MTRMGLKEFRRRSFRTFRPNRSTETSNMSSNEEPSSRELSSVGSITPPSPIEESSASLNSQLLAPPRPPTDSNSNRYSIVESVMNESQSTKCLQNGNPPSRYAPQVTNIQDKATVYQKILLVTGVIGQNPEPQIDGLLYVHRRDRAFPSVFWPISAGQFKALVYLLPGPNAITFSYQKPGSSEAHTSTIIIYMFCPMNAPPLELAILVAKDSPRTFGCTPARAQQDENNMEAAIRKFRMAAYLWQSFTADQMERSGLGRRTFRFEEEWTTATSHPRDFHDKVMRSEARIHIIQTDKTVAEIRALEPPRANSTSTANHELVEITSAALREKLDIQPGQKRHVAVIILDSHWDAKEKLVRGHVEFGGPVGDDLHLAIFGSHCLQNYPSSLADVVQAFQDCTPMELKVGIDDANVDSSSWEVAAYGIGAHLREVGRLLGSRRQEKGIMAEDFVTFSRAFLLREPFSKRTKSRSKPIEPKDEPIWHRLDLLRFRFHPLFRNGTDKLPHPDTTVHGWPIEKDKLLVTARSGLLCTEIFAEGDDFSTASIEYPRDQTLVRSITLTEAELRGYLPDKQRRSKLKIIVRSISGGELVVEDVHQLCTKSSIKLTSGPLAQLAFRSTKVGFSQIKGSPEEIVFNTAVSKHKHILTGVTVYHGDAVDGLEFHYDNGSSQLFGKRGENKDNITLNIQAAEVLLGFGVRAGSWVDAIQIITSKRRTPFYGNERGGSMYDLMVPSGFKVCGLSGTCAEWIDSLALLITR
ncbi:metallopeptidase [Xylaria sp. CBS 124048]|nr:metallopeptidase [Xylaria sp. CBS 124048]